MDLKTNEIKKKKRASAKNKMEFFFVRNKKNERSWRKEEKKRDGPNKGDGQKKRDQEKKRKTKISIGRY